MSKSNLRESEIEMAHLKHVKDQGGASFKFVSPQRRSVPDRLDLYPVPEKDRHVVANYVQFTECKRPGEKPTDAQKREHDRLRALGFQVNVVDQLPSNKPKE